MFNNTQWANAHEAWSDFTRQHPELGYRSGKWQLHNFLRIHRQELLAADAIRLAKNKFWIAHGERFIKTAFALATGVRP